MVCVRVLGGAGAEARWPPPHLLLVAAAPGGGAVGRQDAARRRAAAGRAAHHRVPARHEEHGGRGAGPLAQRWGSELDGVAVISPAGILILLAKMQLRTKTVNDIWTKRDCQLGSLT